MRVQCLYRINYTFTLLRCVVRMFIDSMMPHAKAGQMTTGKTDPRLLHGLSGLASFNGDILIFEPMLSR